MLALKVYICDRCGKVHNQGEILCMDCTNEFIGLPIIPDNLSRLEQNNSFNFAKNKKILDVILADARNKIKKQFGVEGEI